jgi:UDP-N-acetyl-2-amino-2-deoxyglucuronate dehydrogenase
MAKNFALIGVGGYVAPRHLKAIKDTGNNLVAAVDPKDSVGIIDSYFDNVRFFVEFERFDRHIEKLRRSGQDRRVDFVSICSPNYLHDAHCRFALRVDADAVCEKPLVLNPWNIDALAELERESGRKIYTVLQLRVNPALIELRNKLMAEKSDRKHDVCLTYITSRGLWYQVSWKGQVERSGGVATNIGIHFFDLLIWLFGSVENSEVHVSEPTRVGGYLELERARVTWFLSIEKKDLPEIARDKSVPTYRSITIDGEEVEFSGGFTDLHTVVYRDVLSGGGFRLDDARPSIELAHQIRNAKPLGVRERSHYILVNTK